MNRRLVTPDKPFAGAYHPAEAVTVFAAASIFRSKLHIIAKKVTSQQDIARSSHRPAEYGAGFRTGTLENFAFKSHCGGREG